MWERWIDYLEFEGTVMRWVKARFSAEVKVRARLGLIERDRVDGWTDRQTDRQTHTHTERERERERERPYP